MIKIIMNPDKEIREDALRQLKENGGYCPCALEKNENTKCMCSYFKEQDEGMCNCALYIKIKE